MPVQAQEWSKVATPSGGSAEVIGSYANGCLAGAVPLPAQAPGYETIRRERNRFWVHPALKQWIDGFGRAMAKLGHVALVGDAAQPRGGPMPGGHGSHQVGLDIDIWFRPGPLPEAERASPTAFSVVRAGGLDLEPGRWQPIFTDMLHAAATAPQTERIFVNAAIKQALCRTVPAGQRDWLRKLRPWYGHDAHFHVRIACPAGSADCVRQDPVPAGDGCGDLAWWFTQEALHPKPGVPKERPPLPARCEAVSSSPAAP
jgi:penicillin-insensitive murein endopeptidase